MTKQTQFLKAFYSGGKVQILTDQESYKMNSVAQANCLVEFPENATEINIGEKVKIWRIWKSGAGSGWKPNPAWK